MEKLLEVKGLRVSFSTYAGEVKAVRGMSFDVFEGETLAMVGESGCGKSVTARAILRLFQHSAGRIEPGSVLRWQGRDVLAMNKRELNALRGGEIAMIFQDAMMSLDPTMTVGKQLIETVRAHGKVSRVEAIRRSMELLSLAELPDPAAQMHRYPHELSGGMRQRVMISMALVSEPRLLIADEPTTALDVTIQAQILELLRKLQKALGMAILLITHDLGVVAGIADRVQIVYAGQILESGTARDLYAAPRHPYSAALMSAVPKRTMERRSELAILPGAPPDLRLALPGCPFAARCRYAMPICRRQMPEAASDNGHTVRCWLRHPMAPRVDLTGGAEHG